MNFDVMQMIFMCFQGVTVTPLGGNECIAAWEHSGNIKALGSTKAATKKQH